MYVRTMNELIDSEKQPVVILFENDEERLHVIDLLTRMEPKDGVRGFSMFPQTEEGQRECTRRMEKGAEEVTALHTRKAPTHESR